MVKNDDMGFHLSILSQQHVNSQLKAQRQPKKKCHKTKIPHWQNYAEQCTAIFSELKVNIPATYLTNRN